MNHIVRKAVFAEKTAIIQDDRPTDLELYTQAAALVPLGAWSCDLRTERLSWTDGVFDLFGLSNEQVPDRRSVVELYDDESRALLQRKRQRAIENCARFSLDARVIRPDGQARWIRIHAATHGVDGRAVTLYGLKQDVTADHARWADLRAQAECDPLTGVANRARFQRFLDRPKIASPLEGIGALLLFDLDDFKRLNDGWGHAAGDVCLTAFGKRLQKAFPNANLVARIGGDEFAVLLPPIGPRSRIIAEVYSMFGDLFSPVPWNGELLALRVSAGLAFASEEHDASPTKLFMAADRALYRAKKSPDNIMMCV